MPPTKTTTYTITLPAHLGLVLRWDTQRTRARRDFPYAVPALPVCPN